MDNPQQEKNGKVIPQKGWIKDLFFPIVNTIFGTILVFLIADLNKPKTGELCILCNINSAEVFLDEEYKGTTAPIDKDNKMYVLKINSVYPGSYQIKLKKDTLYNGFIPDVVINPGYRTSKYVELKKSKADFKNNKALNWNGLKNKISQETYSDKAKHNKTELEKVTSKSNQSEQTNVESVNGEPTVISSTKNPITRKLTIWIDGKIPLEKVSFFVNSSFMSTPSSRQFSIELPEGKNTITFIYSDAIGNNYKYTITRNISADDTFILEKNDFELN
jgi:hypothetical protein